MQTTKIMAIAAVVVMVAAAAIGLGYAFQATYTDQISGTGSGDGQFLTVTDATYGGTKAIKIEDTTASTLYLNCGTDIVKSSGTYTRYWDSTDATLSTTTAGTEITTTYSITTIGTQQASITVKALYCLGAYTVKAPVESTSATVSVSDTGLGTASQTPTGYSATSSNVYYVLSTSNTYADLNVAANNINLENQTIGTEGVTYYLYAVAIWVLGSPSADAVDAALSLSASTPVVTASASTYGSA